jgi:exportin-2 (importin alpha re-exporter)
MLLTCLLGADSHFFAFSRRAPTYSSLCKLLGEPQYFTKSNEADDDVAITAIDFEEQAAGYQAAYSRLAASEMPQPDPVGYVQNPLQYFQQELEKLRGRIGEQVNGLIAAAEGGKMS